MRKLSAPIFVVAALLAIFGSAFSALAGASASDPSAAQFAHPDVFLIGRVGPNISGITPQQFRKAYGIDKLSQQGKGITIGIDDACGNPNAQSDLNTYDTQFHLPSITIKIVQPQGTPCTDPLWGLETDLDLQMAHAVAPQAKLVLEEAVTSRNKNLFLAAQDAYMKQGATLVSMSFGSGEYKGETGPIGDGIFSAGNKMGVSFTASSGDSGCGSQYPAASPFVTSVGGTTLVTKKDGTYVSESAWNGSGGGPSTVEKRPSYQNGFNKNSMRSIPDVSLVSLGMAMYDAQEGGFVVVGGTSIAAPMWSGVLADANGGRSSTLKNADPALYSIAKNTSKYARDFHDITTGSSGGICVAKKGYDYVTGLGTPKANNLVPDLIAFKN